MTDHPATLSSVAPESKQGVARTNPADRTPRRNKAILDRAVEDEMLLFDPGTNKLHTLNKPASLIWQHCDGRQTLRMLADLLCRHYAVSIERAEADVRHLVEAMTAQGLLLE